MKPRQNILGILSLVLLLAGMSYGQNIHVKTNDEDSTPGSLNQIGVVKFKDYAAKGTLKIFDRDSNLIWQKVFYDPLTGINAGKLCSPAFQYRLSEDSRIITFYHQSDFQEPTEHDSIFVYDSEGIKIIAIPFSMYQIKSIKSGRISDNGQYAAWEVGKRILFIDVENKRHTLYPPLDVKADESVIVVSLKNGGKAKLYFPMGSYYSMVYVDEMFD